MDSPSQAEDAKFFQTMMAVSPHATVNWEGARKSENVEDFRNVSDLSPNLRQLEKFAEEFDNEVLLDAMRNEGLIPKGEFASLKKSFDSWVKKQK